MLGIARLRWDEGDITELKSMSNDTFKALLNQGVANMYHEASKAVVVWGGTLPTLEVLTQEHLFKEDKRSTILARELTIEHLLALAKNAKQEAEGTTDDVEAAGHHDASPNDPGDSVGRIDQIDSELSELHDQLDNLRDQLQRAPQA